MLIATTCNTEFSGIRLKLDIRLSQNLNILKFWKMKIFDFFEKWPPDYLLQNNLFPGLKSKKPPPFCCWASFFLPGSFIRIEFARILFFSIFFFLFFLQNDSFPLKMEVFPPKMAVFWDILRWKNAYCTPRPISAAALAALYLYEVLKCQPLELAW